MAKVIPRKTPLPILKTFKVENGAMTATNLDLFLEKKTDTPAGLYKFVGKDVVKSDLDPADFPVIPADAQFAPSGSIDRDELIYNLERAEKSASDDPTRFIINSVALVVKEGKASLIATDGRRMSLSNLDTAALADGEYVIPSNRGLAGALKSLAPGKLEFGIFKDPKGAEQIQFKGADGRVGSRLIEGRFPNYTNVLPEAKSMLTLSREQLAEALGELKPYAKEAQAKFKNKFNKASLVVYIDKQTDGLVFTAGPEGQRKSVKVPYTEEAGPFAKPEAGNVVMEMEIGEGAPPSGFGKFDMSFLIDAVDGVRGENVFLGKTEMKGQPMLVTGKPPPKLGEKAVPAKKAPREAKKDRLVGTRVRLKSTGPRSYGVVEKLPKEDSDLPGEEFYRVKDEKTGQVATVEKKDLLPIRVRAKGVGSEMEIPGQIPQEMEDRALMGDAGFLEEPPSGPPVPTTPAATATENLPPPIEMPELVEMAHDLLNGKYPVVIEKMRKAGVRGYFSPGQEKIALSADISKDAAGAAKTLAHEIGHAVDWLDEKDMARGNILGRIGSLRKYMASMLDEMPTDATRVLTAAEREKIRSQLVGDLVRKSGETMQKFIKDPVFRKQIAEQIPALYKRRIEAEAAKRGLITKEQVMSELKASSQVWKPFDELADPQFTAYRYSSPELYADAISVLFNNPALLKKVAPAFYKSWFAYLEKKPSVSSEYMGIIERIKAGAVPEARQARVEGMFEAGERQAAAERLAAEEKPRDIVAGLRQTLIDKNEGILAYIRQAKKQGVAIKPEDNPQYWLEEMNYSGSEAKAFVQGGSEIYKALEASGIGWERLGEVLFHQRVIGERGKMFNPLGFTPESSAAQLEYLRRQMGDEKWGLLLKAVDGFRRNREVIISKLNDSGMLSGPLMAKINQNPEYATFDVFVKHADDLSGGGSGAGAKIYGQVGTLQEISNPATATMMKDIALIKAVNKNTAARKTAEFLSQNFGPEVIRPAEERWNGMAKSPVEPREQGKGLLTYMQDGKLKGFVVDEAVAKAFRSDPNSLQPVVDVLRHSLTFFREVFVQRNPGFMAFNLFRDFFRAYKNLPRAGLKDVARLYYGSLNESFRRGFDIPDPLVKEMLQKKMLITMEERWGLSTEDEQIRAVMERYVPGRAGGDPGAMTALKNAYKWVGDVGSAIEAMPKIAGYKYLKAHQKELGLSDEMISHMIRTQIGSPDFLRRGSAYGLYNGIFMFANPIKEGWRGDLEVLRERPGEYAWKSARLNMIPKLLMWGAGLGMMGAGMKRVMDGASEYDKTNYLIIPLGETENGKSVYIRIPQDEAGRALSGIFWKMLNFGKDKSLANLFDFMAGQAPTLNPAISMAFQTMLYVSGQNPYDFFRQRNVVPEQVFEAGGMRSHAAFLKHIWNSAGLGIVYRFPTDNLEKVKSHAEQVIGAPILSNILGRFIKITNYGKFEELQRVSKMARGSQARRSLDERDAIVANVNSATKPGPVEAAALYADMVKMGMLRRRGGASVVAFNEFQANYQRFASRRVADPYINALIFARSNDERASLLQHYRKTMKKEEYDKVISDAMAGGHLTADPLMLSYIKEDNNGRR